MRRRELKKIEYCLHMAYMWIISLRDAQAVYKDDLKVYNQAKKYLEKDIRRLERKQQTKSSLGQLNPTTNALLQLFREQQQNKKV